MQKVIIRTDYKRKWKDSTVNQWVGCLGSAARLRASMNDVLQEIWKSMAVPTIMYGMDVMVWHENDRETKSRTE